MLKAAANATKGPHFELVKVRISAAWKQKEGSVHLGTQRDASPGGGGPSLQGHARPDSASFSCALARRHRAETSHTGQSCHPHGACSVRSVAAYLFIENGDGRQACLYEFAVKNELNPIGGTGRGPIGAGGPALTRRAGGVSAGVNQGRLEGKHRCCVCRF